MKGIKLILKWSSKYIYFFIGIIVLTLILQWLYSYLPLFVQYALAVLGYDDVSKVALPKFLTDIFNQGNSTLNIILIIAITMVVVQAFRSVLRFLCSFFQGTLAQFIVHDLKNKMYKKIVDLPFSYHKNSDVGDLIQRTTTDIDKVSSFLSVNVSGLLSIVITIFIGSYQVSQISIPLMLVSLVIVPITAVSSILFYRYCNKQFTEIEEKESDMTSIIQENVNSARVVRAFANEKYEFDKMDAAAIKYRDKYIRFNNATALFWGLSDFIAFLQYGLTISVGIYLARSGQLEAASIIAAMILMNMILWPMRGLGRIISEFGKSSVAAKRIDEILSKDSEYVINGDKCPTIKGNIEFNDVSFKFSDDNKHLLEGLSFNIKAGQTVAIVGKTGSGKSTICNILTRFLEYDSGSVLIDGVELKDIEKKYLRKNIKYVMQNPYLFSKTIYENIAISSKDSSNEMVRNASKIAQIDNEIMKFDEGYDTLIGENGTTLSGGQKQRVAIARMLISDSPVIIFDDSLSALDTKTDLFIRQSLKQKDKDQTMIIITHRTTTAKEADLIIVLDNGKVSDMGTHDELKDKPGLYKELWGIQGELEKEFNNVLKGGELSYAKE